MRVSPLPNHFHSQHSIISILWKSTVPPPVPERWSGRQVQAWEVGLPRPRDPQQWPFSFLFLVDYHVFLWFLSILEFKIKALEITLCPSLSRYLHRNGGVNPVSKLLTSACFLSSPSAPGASEAHGCPPGHQCLGRAHCSLRQGGWTFLKNNLASVLAVEG